MPNGFDISIVWRFYNVAPTELIFHRHYDTPPLRCNFKLFFYLDDKNICPKFVDKCPRIQLYRIKIR